MYNFITVKDVADIDALVEQALKYKADPFAGREQCAGKRIGLLFLNPSLRTRLSTQVAAGNLGMDAHLAPLAIEHGAELYSCDADFARFKVLTWRNPVT